MEGAVWDSNRCLELEQPVAWVEVLAGGRGGHRRVLNNRGVKSDCCNTTLRVRHPRIRTRPPIDGLRRRLRVRSNGGARDRAGHTSASLLWWKPGTAGEFQNQIFQDQIFQDQIVVCLSHSRSQASSIRAYAWISSALKNSEISRLALSAESEP